MTTETEAPTFKGNPPDDDVLEEMRDLLAEALRGHANIAANTSIHLEELGDAEGASGEMVVALLSVWMADNVRAWTHTTRLREGLIKFDPKAAGVALAELVTGLDVEIVARKPEATIPDDCDGDSEVCHACHTHHPGGVGGAWCPAAGYVRPVAPVVSPDELDENDPEWRP